MLIELPNCFICQRASLEVAATRFLGRDKYLCTHHCQPILTRALLPGDLVPEGRLEQWLGWVEEAAAAELKGGSMMGLNTHINIEGIRTDFSTGMSQTAIADKYQCARSTVAWHLRDLLKAGKAESAEAGPPSVDESLSEITTVKRNGQAAIDSPAPAAVKANGNGHAEALLAAIEREADEQWRRFDVARKVRAVWNSGGISPTA